MFWSKCKGFCAFAHLKLQKQKVKSHTGVWMLWQKKTVISLLTASTCNNVLYFLMKIMDQITKRSFLVFYDFHKRCNKCVFPATWNYPSSACMHVNTWFSCVLLQHKPLKWIYIYVENELHAASCLKTFLKLFLKYTKVFYKENAGKCIL